MDAIIYKQKKNEFIRQINNHRSHIAQINSSIDSYNNEIARNNREIATCRNGSDIQLS